MVKERAEEECMSLGEAYNEGYEQGKADGAREFAEWLGIKEEHVDTVLAEWQKGKDNE